MQEALDEERFARQSNAGITGGSNDRSPPSRAIIKCSISIWIIFLLTSPSHKSNQWCAAAPVEFDRFKTHASDRECTPIPSSSFWCQQRERRPRTRHFLWGPQTTWNYRNSRQGLSRTWRFWKYCQWSLLCNWTWRQCWGWTGAQTCVFMFGGFPPQVESDPDFEYSLACSSGACNPPPCRRHVYDENCMQSRYL